MADPLPDTVIARVQGNLSQFAGVGVDLFDPASVGNLGAFWGWPNCTIESKVFSDPASPTLILCAKPAPGTQWTPGLDSLVIDEPLWLYINSGAVLDADAANALVTQMASWPAGVKPALDVIPANGALRAVGKLSLTSWPALGAIAAAVGLDTNQQVFASIDFPAGFPRVVVWAERDSIGGVVTKARVVLSSILGPSIQRLDLYVSGKIPLGGEDELDLKAAVPLDGGVIIANGTFTISPSTLTKILPFYKGGKATLGAEMELTAMAGSLALNRISAEVAVAGVNLIPDLLTVDADARIAIINPLNRSVRFAMATLAGEARFGSGHDGLALDVVASYPAGEFKLSLAPGSHFDVMSFLGLFGAKGLPPLVVTTASVTYLERAHYLSAQVGAHCDWAIGPVHFTYVGFGIQGTGSPYIVSFQTTATLGPILLGVNAVYNPDSGWSLAGVAQTSATIADLLDAMHLPPASVPEFLHKIAIDELTAYVSDSMADFSCTLTVEGIDVTIGLHATKDTAAGPGASWKLAGGTLVLGGQSFTVDLAKSATGTGLIASYSTVPGHDPLSIEQIATALGIPTPAILTGVLGQTKITSARLVIDKSPAAGSSFSIAATVDKVSVALLRVTPAGGTAKTFAAASLDLGIGLASLPLIGGAIGAAENLGIRHLDVILGAPKVADLQKLAAAFGPGAGPSTYPAEDVTSQVALSLQLQLGAAAMRPLLLASEAAHMTPPPNALPPDASAPPATTGGTWLNVQRGFGPINIRRVGVSLPDGDLWLMLEAGFTIAGVDLELQGLALRFTPTLPPAVKTPVLRGLALSFDSGGVRLGGGLLAVPQPGGGTEYDGQIMLEGASFQLTAIGSYAPSPQGASLFGFVILDRPLGGPPCFYVTAVAAGFGFNRTLNIPPIEGVPNFALVKAVSGTGPSPFPANTDLAGALRVMQKDVPVEYGENWLALGVRFTTFKLLESFALAYAKFGSELEIGLLGRSTLTVPTNAPHPIGYAELALQASFKPNDGVLSICGQLTPASYVLSPDCHLTGGFAYMAWFKDAGDAKAGDFVVTLGGYHPSFKRPAWYPVEPRVGANWQVTPNLLIKSTLYFALTPSSVMAGGSLDATWQSGDLKAWFTLAADFLLCWKPFYYEAEVAVSLGASYRVDLWLTSFTVTVSVGVDIHFWGPPFAGTAKVDLYVVRFTISFGSSDATRTPIDWRDFKDSFLPHAPAPPAPRALKGMLGAADPTPTPTEAWCFTRVSGGLVKDLKASSGRGDVDWVINPERLELTTCSVVPITDATLKLGSGTDTTIGGKGTIWKTAFGVGPVGVANGDLVSTHAIALTRRDGNPPPDAFHFAPPAPILENIPSATWSKDVAMTPGLGQANGVPVITALTGFVFTAKAPLSGAPLTVDVSLLKFSDDPFERTFAWATPTIEADDLDQSTAADTFKTTLLSAADTRLNILKALKGQGLAVNQAPDVSALSRSAADVLVSAPALARLGAEKGGA